ncbi:MAG: DUF1987 domain-containing protein [Bacteroidales bacterium]|nr:DUF1987 domain-containing protein [Bacteroidales bacterium]
MKSLYVKGTPVSPFVDFNIELRMLQISGFSRPENVRDFYFPLIQWLDELNNWMKSNKSLNVEVEPFTFKFKFIYFNSSSAKFIYDIIIMLNGFQRDGFPIKIYWYFDEDDDELREAGEELSDMANVPFFYIATKKE